MVSGKKPLLVCLDLQHKVPTTVPQLQGLSGTTCAGIFKVRVKFPGNGILNELTTFDMVLLQMRYGSRNVKDV